MYAYIYLFILVCKRIFSHETMCAHVRVCMFTCAYTYACLKELGRCMYTNFKSYSTCVFIHNLIFMCINIYVCTCVCLFVCMHGTYRYTYERVYIICMCIYMHVQKKTKHSPTCAHGLISIYMYTNRYTCIHVHIYACVYSYIYIYIYT